VRSPPAVAPYALGDRVDFTVPAFVAPTAPLTLGDALMLAFLRSTLATVVILAILTPSSAHAQSSFTSFADFLAAVGSNGVDTFDDLPAFGVVSGPINRQAGSFGYTVAANGTGGSLFFPLENPAASSDVWLSTEDALAGMTFSNFGTGIRALGGRFFATDVDGFLSGTSVVFVAEDINGNSVERTWTPRSTDEFFGALFGFPIRSLRITAVNDPLAGDAYFATANDLVLAEARTPVSVPEPSTLLLVAVPLLLMAYRRPRRND